MKKVVLKSITLRNFRGEKERTTDFNADGETTVAGDNGLGKSRHFDAFTWLLFGKDSFDRKDHEIRTVEDGNVLHRVECSVEATLWVDGCPLVLKRAFVERWVKPRGQTEEVFRGNETETHWNGVPVAVGEYQRRIRYVIDDSVFKMVTNPAYFAGMKWQDQREQLFRLAGTVSDEEIAAGKPDFAALLDRISGKSFADFKSELAARKKRLKADLGQIQPRIDQTQKLMPEASDFAAIEAEIERLNTETAGIDKSVADEMKAAADRAEAARQQGEARAKTQRRINELKAERDRVVFEAQQEENKTFYADSESRQRLVSRINLTANEIADKTGSIQRLRGEVATAKAHVAAKRDEVQALRLKWAEENEAEYSGTDICNCCGQTLPEHMKADARRLFADAKVKKLDEIRAKGGEMNNCIVGMERDIVLTDGKIEKALGEKGEREQLFSDLKRELLDMPVPVQIQVNADDLPECRELADRIAELEKELRPADADTETAADTSAAELRKTRKIALQNEMRALEATLRNRELTAKYAREIKDLEAQGKSLARQLADAEREEYIAAQFTKARIEECEKRINGIFDYVTFKLFDYTIEGNESETCTALINGVPFSVANTAGQVNAGLDIINALVRFYGVSAPIFIDRRESVNRIIPTESQIINLAVSRDKTLTIK